MDWFLYDSDFRHKRGKKYFHITHLTHIIKDYFPRFCTATVMTRIAKVGTKTYLSNFWGGSCIMKTCTVGRTGNFASKCGIWFQV